MAIKIVDLAAETSPTGDDLIIVRDNATGTTRKITITTFLLAFKYLYSPTGQMTQYAASTAPDGWLMCDGSAVSRSTYSDLFALIGTTYGAGNGTTSFNVPDMRGRMPVGKAATGTFGTLNASGGTETETLTSDQMPAHSHGVGDPSHAHGVYDPGHSHSLRGKNNLGGNSTPGAVQWGPNFENGSGGVNPAGTNIGIYAAYTGISIQNSGGGQSHNNLPPYRVTNFIIKT